MTGLAAEKKRRKNGGFAAILPSLFRQMANVILSAAKDLTRGRGVGRRASKKSKNTSLRGGTTKQSLDNQIQ
jgi:hypothetical protein